MTTWITSPAVMIPSNATHLFRGFPSWSILGLTESAVEVKFADDPADGPCLRIYAAAIDVKTFPFLTKSHQLLYTLEKIITHDQIHGRQLEQILQDQMQYGSSHTTRHMEWEA